MKTTAVKAANTRASGQNYLLAGVLALSLCASLAGCTNSLSQNSSQKSALTELPVLKNGVYEPTGGVGEYKELKFPLMPCGESLNDPWGDWTKPECGQHYPLTPKGREMMEKYVSGEIPDPAFNCVPENPGRSVSGLVPWQVEAKGDILEIRYLYGLVRQIHLDGAKPDPDLAHSGAGFSTARVQGDTLIIETTHMTDNLWGGATYPLSEEGRIIERYWPAPDGEKVLLDMMIDDPVYYTEPFLATRRELSFLPDEKLDITPCEPIPY